LLYLICTRGSHTISGTPPMAQCVTPTQVTPTFTLLGVKWGP
jgi:hypothetical protein